MDTYNSTGRKRRATDELDSDVNLHLKHMGDALKSRLECEIEAFCTNVQTFVREQEKNSATATVSPPQRVPLEDSFALENSETFASNPEPVSSSSYCEESRQISCSRQLFDAEEPGPDFQNCESDEQGSQTELNYLHNLLIERSLKLLNCALDKGVI